MDFKDDAMCCSEQIMEAALQKTAATELPNSYLTKKKEPLNGKPLKSIDNFTYLGSNISTESDVNIHMRKVWTATDKL